MALNPELRLGDFSGGLNLLDDPAPNEAIDMWNVQIDRLGRVQKRLGYTRDNATTNFGAAMQNAHWSTALGQFIFQEGPNVRKRTGADAYSLIKAFTTTHAVAFADFKGKLLMLHQVDGLFSYDGTTLAGPLGPAGPTIKGKALAAWQNKCWVAVGQDT